MRNLKPADECECKDILTAIENFSHLALEVADVGLKAVTLPHFNGEKMVVVLFCLLVGGVPSEKHFSYLIDVVERIGW